MLRSTKGGAHDQCVAPVAVSLVCNQMRLSEIDRPRLQTCIRTGRASGRIRTRAQVLLKLGEGWSLPEVSHAFDVCRNAAVRVRTRFAAGGVDAVLTEQRQTRYRQALTGAQKAHLIAVACSPAPEGHDNWTLRLLAGKTGELGFVETISPETIRALLKRTSSNPGSIGSGASRR